MNKKWFVAAGLVLALVGAISMSAVVRAQEQDDVAGYGEGLGDLSTDSLALPADAAPPDAWGLIEDGPGRGPDDGRRGAYRGSRHHRGLVLQMVAAELDMERDELLEALKDGATVADLAEELGLSLDDIVDAVMAPIADHLAVDVKYGLITQEEADERLAAIRDELTQRFSEPFEPREPGPGARPPGRGGKLGLVGNMIGIVAEELGMERDELREALVDGQTVAELAAEKGVSLDEIVDALVEPLAERLAEAVENGRMTQEEADEKLAQIRDDLTQRLSEPFEPRGGGGGIGGGRRGGR